MARGEFWRCSQLKVIRENLDKTDAELGRMVGRKPQAVSDFRWKYRLMKVPQRRPKCAGPAP